jgi:hypothetical protein
MERESKNQKKETEKKARWPEYYAVPTVLSDTKCKFESSNSRCISAVLSLDNEHWEYIGEAYRTGVNYYAKILGDIQKSIHPRSKRYIEGWSPSLNFTTEAFFGNFQSGYIKWSALWPNTRIPISETTSTGYLKECCIIEVDFDSIEESINNVEKATPKIVLANHNVVGELTRKEILFNTDQCTTDVKYRQSFTA